MAVIPPDVVAGIFLVAAIIGVAVLVYMVRGGSKPTGFFSEAVSDRYVMDLPEAEIDAFYDLRDKFMRQVGYTGPAEGEKPEHWAAKLPQEERRAICQSLMNRLVKTIERLDKVQTEKPGSWKLWQKKLISEQYWASLVEAEKIVGEEIDVCMAEADELEPGWREHIFPQAVQLWRMEKQQLAAKKEQKKAVEKHKKDKEKEARRSVVQAKQEIEDQIRQEKAAEKAMEKLLREEELAAKKEKGKAKAKPKKK